MDDHRKKGDRDEISLRMEEARIILGPASNLPYNPIPHCVLDDKSSQWD